MYLELAEGGCAAFNFQVDGFIRVRLARPGRVVQAVLTEMDILRGVVDYDAEVELPSTGDLHRLPDGKSCFFRLHDDLFPAHSQDQSFRLGQVSFDVDVIKAALQVCEWIGIVRL